MHSVTDLRRRDRLTVVTADGKEREVFGWATIQRTSTVRGSNPVVDHGKPGIYAGDAIGLKPDAVTHWLAEEIQDEFGVDVRDHDILVIDPTSEEVDVL